jgi:hypothetical protein
MENKKKLGFLLIFVGLVLLFLIIYLFFFKKTPDQAPVVGNNDTASSTELPPSDTLFMEAKKEESNKVYSFDEATEERREESLEDAKKKAMAFAERFGSFSNEGNYGNIKDLELSMTDKMKVWAENFIAEKNKEKYSGSYYGIEAHALTSSIKSYDQAAGVVDISVTTRRVEKVASETPKEYQQDIVISMIKEDASWIVDSATWQKK